MKILIHGVNYAPEMIGIAKYTREMTEWLLSQGHTVKVVTAPPHYPYWKIDEGYTKKHYQREVLNGVEVYRTPVWIPSKMTPLGRILFAISFAVTSFPIVLWKCLSWRPQMVVAVAPSLPSSFGAWFSARLCGGKVVIHVQDLELDVATGVGMLKEGFLVRMLFKWESWLLRRFDRVSAVSESMVNQIGAKRVERSKLTMFPNWVDTKSVYPLAKGRCLRGELGISADTITALYSGNMGVKHGLDIIIEAAIRLERNSKVQFILCGGGADRNRLEQLASNLSNVTFIDLQPQRKLNMLLNVADVHLLPHGTSVHDFLMPSKLIGMLASGRPVVASVQDESEVARVVSQCGVVTKPGDSEGFAQAIAGLASDGDARKKLGSKARVMAEKEWEKENVLSNFEQALKDLIKD